MKRIPNLMLALVSTTALLGCAMETEDSELAQVHQKAIFGDDNLEDWISVSDQRLKHLGESVAALFDASLISCAGASCDVTSPTFRPHGTSVETGPDGIYYPICRRLPFTDTQYAGAACTGFLVGPDIVATAGHCLGHGDCYPNGQNPSLPDNGAEQVIFDYRADASGVMPQVKTISASDVYHCVEVLAWGWPEVSGEDDYAFFRLDRKVSGRTPFIAQYSGLPRTEDEYVAYGHPMSWPLKVAEDSAIIAIQDDGRYLDVRADTFGGSSGGPLLNALTGVVSAINFGGSGRLLRGGGIRRREICRRFVCR